MVNRAHLARSAALVALAAAAISLPLHQRAGRRRSRHGGFHPRGHADSRRRQPRRAPRLPALSETAAGRAGARRAAPRRPVPAPRLQWQGHRRHCTRALPRSAAGRNARRTRPGRHRVARLRPRRYRAAQDRSKWRARSPRPCRLPRGWQADLDGGAGRRPPSRHGQRRQSQPAAPRHGVRRHRRPAWALGSRSRPPP